LRVFVGDNVNGGGALRPGTPRGVFDQGAPDATAPRLRLHEKPIQLLHACRPRKKRGKTSDLSIHFRNPNPLLLQLGQRKMNGLGMLQQVSAIARDCQGGAALKLFQQQPFFRFSVSDLNRHANYRPASTGRASVCSLSEESGASTLTGAVETMAPGGAVPGAAALQLITQTS
jgi:hypothetical protein